MVKGRGIGMLGGASESFPPGFVGCGALAAAALVWGPRGSLRASARAPQALH